MSFLNEEAYSIENASMRKSKISKIISRGSQNYKKCSHEEAKNAEDEEEVRCQLNEEAI